MPHKIKKYGWKKDKLDNRDIKYHALTYELAEMPKHLDLRDKMPPVYDQSELGSCTANSVGGVCHAEEIKAGLSPILMPSRLFIYYNTRAIEGTVSSDSGAEIRDTIKAVAKLGYCDETVWPYNINRFTRKPTATAYKLALPHHITSYNRVTQTLPQIKHALVAGHPISFGFTVYESFESDKVAKTGVVPMPGNSEEPIGGHAVVLVGYDDDSSRLLVRNSWGVGWGLRGYFWMPYEYVLDTELASDFWIITRVPR